MACADLAVAYLNPLIDWLARRSDRRIWRDLIEEAAGEAIVSLGKSSSIFDSTRSRAALPLFAFLKLAAYRDLQNLLQREKAQRRGWIALKSVEDLERRRKYVPGEEDPSAGMERRDEAMKADREVLALVRQGLDERELRVLELMLEGVRKNEPFAQALGIEYEPKETRAAQVKRVKDKLKMRINRVNHGGAP